MEVSEMKNPTKSAFILIDMEQGFIDPASAHCIKGAAATVPTCEKAIQMSRQKGIPIFFVKRVYPYIYGLYETGPQSKIYVTSGMFYWGVPLRFFAPSEIVLLHIKGHD